MKSFCSVVLACCLIAAAVLLVGERAADGAGAQSADSRARGAAVDQRMPGGVGAASKSALRPELERVIRQMDLLVSQGVDLDPGAPGGIGAARSLSARLRDELFAEFRKAGGTNEELLEWLSEIVARGGRNEDLLKRVIHHAVVEASSIPGRAALDWLVSQPDPDFTTAFLFEQAARAWLRDDRKQALRWIERNGDRFEGHGLRFVVADWPNDDVAGAWEWLAPRLEAEGGSLHAGSVSEVARRWARQDPAGVFDWMSGLEGRWRGPVLLGIAQGMPDEGLPVAAAWIGRYRDVGRELDNIRSVVANRIAGSEPRIAIEVAADITDQAERERAVITAARNLYLVDPESVLRWFPESGLTTAAQHEIVSGD